MKRLQELYNEAHQCYKNHEAHISPKNAAIVMLTAAQYIEDGNFGMGSTYTDPAMNAFWEEMEDNWATFTGIDRDRIVKVLRWGARDFLNNTEWWLAAIQELDNEDRELNCERYCCINQ